MNKTPPPGWKLVDSDVDGFGCDSSDGLRLIASWGMGWEHVSVSHRDRCPTWNEMESVARHFWPDQTAVQYHVAKDKHINVHNNCLHWWRPTIGDIPTPPTWMIA